MLAPVGIIFVTSLCSTPVLVVWVLVKLGVFTPQSFFNKCILVLYKLGAFTPGSFFNAYLVLFFWPLTGLYTMIRMTIARCCSRPTFLYVDRARGSVFEVEDMVQEEGTVRFVCISDTHRTHNWLRVPEGDVLLHCGDILVADRATGRGVGHLAEFDEFLGRQPHEYKVVIAGNHDATAQDLGYERMQGVLSNATYLENNSTQVKGGLVVYGSPSSRRGYSENKAFQYPGNSPELEEIWSKIRPGVDVLMTHDLPAGHRSRGGCRLLARVIEEIKPQVHVFGHIHEAHGAKFLDRCLSICACTVNRFYTPLHAPIVFDLPMKTSSD